MTKNLARFDPFADLEELRTRVFDDGWLAPLRGARLPLTDVYTEDDDRLVVEAHLADFAKSDIAVDLDGDVLVITAERRTTEMDQHRRYVVRESSTSMYRRIALPERADRTAISATFEGGVLRVLVPFTAAAAPTSIAIESGTHEETA